MQSSLPLEPGHYYHIFNRGVNRTNIFNEDRNYAHFLTLYARHVSPVVDTFAYCLLGNHFHLLVRIRTEPVADRSGSELPGQRSVIQAFNNWLNAYAKAINKAYDRTGSLFQRRFGRLAVTSERHLVAVVHYIHYNPQKHGFVKNFRDWPHSSYDALLSDKPTRLARSAVLDWFGGQQELRRVHAFPADESVIAAYIGDDEA